MFSNETQTSTAVNINACHKTEAHQYCNKGKQRERNIVEAMEWMEMNENEMKKLFQQ